VQEAGAEDVDKAVAAAHRAFYAPDSPWRALGGTGRRDVLLRIADGIEKDKAYLEALEATDNGKPAYNAGYSTQVDVALTVKHFRYFAGWADKISGQTIPVEGDFFCYTKREAVGVVGAIIPWNFPLLMLAWKMAPALAAGCTVVLKSSEKTPLTALAFAKIAKEAGVPPGVVNILSGFGPSAGEALVRHADVDKIAFTGSSFVGKRIMKSIGESSRLKKVSLELGGKSGLIVCKDADLDLAVDVAEVGLFLNHGQCCCASSRLFVHEDIYDEFTQKAVRKIKKRKLGDPFDPESVQGPQVDKLQYDRVMNYIDIGKEKDKATLLHGGGRPKMFDKGYYVESTVFADVTDDMVIAKEEIFGPVMSILKFKSEEEVIARANSSQFGLAAGVITKDMQTALRISDQLRAGTVWLNTYNTFDAASPFGGFKDSGIGREKGEDALHEYTEVKCVVTPSK